MSLPLTEISSENVTIRPLRGPEDFKRVEQAQRQIWNFENLEVVPAALFSVAHHFGGQTLGAFDGEQLVGFALSFGAVEDGHAHIHSHMVGILLKYQNAGLEGAPSSRSVTMRCGAASTGLLGPTIPCS